MKNDGLDWTGVDSPAPLNWEGVEDAPISNDTAPLDWSGISVTPEVPDYSEVFRGSGIVDGDGNEVSPSKLQAYMYNFAYEASSVYRGIQQFFGIDDKTLKDQEAVSKILLEDEEVGRAAMGGMVTGMLAEPVGLLIPAAKGVTLAKAVARGSAMGVAYGGALYVEEGRSRLANAAMGGTIGAVAVPAIRAVGKGIKWNKIRKANKTISAVEKEWASLLTKGATQEQAATLMKMSYPTLSADMKAATRLTGRTPSFAATREEAESVAAFYNSSTKQNNLNIGRALDVAAGALSTRIAKISPAVKHRVREYERKILQNTHDMLDKVDPFLRSFSKLPKQQQAALSKALMNGDAHDIETILKGTKGKVWDEYLKVKGVLDSVGDELLSLGRLSKKLHNYYPRIIKDKEGLFQAIGKTEKSAVETALADAERKVASRGYPLSPIEESEIINNVIRGFGARRMTEARPGFAKARGIETLTDDLMKFYENPTAALHSYLRNAVTDIEKFKFFGKHIKYNKTEGARLLDVDGSVGAIVRDVMKNESLSPTQENELIHLLNTRFGIGEKGAGALMQDTKSLLYAGLLGNPISAATQLGDLGVGMYINGFKNTLTGMVKSILGRSKVTVKEFGLTDHIAEEFANVRGTARFLNKMFKWGGFAAVDRLGKQALINGSLSRTLKQVKSPKGLKAFTEKYSKSYGPEEFPLLVEDLKAGNITDRVKAMLFSELADVQPIVRSEMPEGYLRMPNGRVVYMLKTFMLKQIDIIRRDGVQEIAKGNVAKGMSNLMRYGIIVGSTNAGAQYVKDMMLGRDVEPKITDVGVNLIKTFGLGEYIFNTIGQGRPLKAAIQMITPPFEVFDNIMQLDPKAMQFMPVFGKLWYYWLGGGIEEYEAKQIEKSFKNMGIAEE